MDKSSLLEVKEIFEEQARSVKDALRLLDVTGFGFVALDEDTEGYIMSTTKIVNSYLEIVYSNLMKGAEEVKQLMDGLGDD